MAEDDDAQREQTADLALGLLVTQKKRIAELEALVSSMHDSGQRFTFDAEFYLQGVRMAQGDYVIMRVGPATVAEHPF